MKTPPSHLARHRPFLCNPLVKFRESREWKLAYISVAISLLRRDGRQYLRSESRVSDFRRFLRFRPANKIIAYISRMRLARAAPYRGKPRLSRRRIRGNFGRRRRLAEARVRSRRRANRHSRREKAIVVDRVTSRCSATCPARIRRWPETGSLPRVRKQRRVARSRADESFGEPRSRTGGTWIPRLAYQRMTLT